MRQQEGDGPPGGVLKAHPYQKTQAKFIQTNILSLYDNCLFKTQSSFTQEISNMIQQDSKCKDLLKEDDSGYYNDWMNDSKKSSKMREEFKKKVKQKVDTFENEQEDPLVHEEKEPNGQKIKPDKNFYKNFVRLPFKRLEKQIGSKEFKQIAKSINIDANVKQEREFFLYLVKIRLNFEQIWDLFKKIIFEELQVFLEGRGQSCQRKEKRDKIRAYVKKLDVQEIQQAFQICFGRINHQDKKAAKQYHIFMMTQKRFEERQSKQQSKSNKRK